MSIVIPRLGYHLLQTSGGTPIFRDAAALPAEGAESLADWSNQRPFSRLEVPARQTGVSERGLRPKVRSSPLLDSRRLAFRSLIGYHQFFVAIETTR
jgi:hypothetical protein